MFAPITHRARITRLLLSKAALALPDECHEHLAHLRVKPPRQRRSTPDRTHSEAQMVSRKTPLLQVAVRMGPTPTAHAPRAASPATSRSREHHGSQ
jgi:hypothetical protein